MILLRFQLILLAAFLLITTEAFSDNHKQNNAVKTTVKSNFIDVKRKSQTIDFTQNVVVEREDTNMLADKMTAYYYENDQRPENITSQDSKAIKEIIATGNVKIFNQDFVATGDYGVYNPQENTFVVKDNVIFNRGTSIAKGERFIYNLNTKKGYLVGKEEEVVGDGEDNRVTVVIGDIDDKKHKNSKDEQ